MPEKSQSLVGSLSGAVILFFILLIVFAKWGPAIPFAVNQTTSNQDLPFMVTGDGKVSAKPDTAIVNFGVETSGNTVLQTQNKSNSVLNAIVSKIKEQGISQDDIKTTNYNIYPQYSDQFSDSPVPVMMSPSSDPSERSVGISQPLMVPANPQQPKIIGYKVNINVSVTVRDLNKVNQIVDTATVNGANQVNGVSFVVDKPEQYQSQARKLAIDDAKKKANELARAAGISLGKVVGVSENAGYYPRPYEFSAKMEGDVSGSSQTQLNPGSTEISTQVTLSYETR